MKPQLPLAALTALVALAAAAGSAAEMKDMLSVEASKPAAYRTKFGSYGYYAQRHVFTDQGGLHFRLPGGVPDVVQTGIYSYFELTGDCEVTLAYELLDIVPPRSGYGSGLGLALDLGEGVGRGSIQRVVRSGEGHGYVLQTSPAAPGGEMTEVNRFVLATAKRGRMCLRRAGKELVFLTGDGPDAELGEADRVPFPAGTIQAVRVYADPGGSQTAVDIRVRELQVRADQIAAAAPPRQESTAWGKVAAVLGVVAGAGLLGWRWRVSRRRADGE
jgi:hypothetical protein